MALMEAHYYTNKQDQVALGAASSCSTGRWRPSRISRCCWRSATWRGGAGHPGREAPERAGAGDRHPSGPIVGSRPACRPGYGRPWPLQAILGGQPQEAQRQLARAAERGRTVLYHILRGKLAELDGRPEVAGDAWQPGLPDGGDRADHLLCQRLGFYSNMEALAPALFNSLGQSKVKLLFWLGQRQRLGFYDRMGRPWRRRCSTAWARAR